jgi:erythronate-4-phosphate dehydrogenase
MKIIVDENMPAIAEMFAAHPVEIIPRSGRTISVQDINDADALLVRSVTKVNQALLKDSKVKFVGSATIGVDHIDQAYLQQQGINFANSPACNAESVTDYVFSCFACLYHEQKFEWWTKTIAIVGCGNVGGRLLARLQALNINVVAYDPPKAKRDNAFKSSTFDNVLSADIICVHTPLTKTGEHKTEHLFDKNVINQLKENTVLLNAGRGEVIDNAALLQRQQTDQDLTLILDVFEFEPEPEIALIQQCFISTPHIAGYSLDGKLRGSYMVYQACCQSFGWQENIFEGEGNFSKLETLSVAQGDDWAQLNRLIMVSFDVRADDGRFRRLFTLNSNAQTFDALRKNYVERREFSTIEVQSDSSDLSLLARSAGFEIK